MKKLLAVIAILCPVLSAQASREQRLADFQQLSALYARHYAPYEWKRDALKFDLFQIQPWLDRVSVAKDDLEFYDICIEYVASLNDGHSYFALPSDFLAFMPFSVDLYDNTPLVYAVSTSRLPASRFPIALGDELVSIDGVSAETLIYALAKYNVSANDRSTARSAASFLTTRWQAYVPRAIDVPDESTVVFRGADGQLKTMRIPWIKSGTPLRNSGPVPSPKADVQRASAAAASYLKPGDPAYLAPIRMLENVRAPKRLDQTVAGYGAIAPVFRPPAGFTQRLGRSGADDFYSGTYMADGLRIGYIRIPDFGPDSQNFALNQFANEIQYMQANTDGLVVDVSRNPGGSACYMEDLLAFVIPTRFRGIGFEIRASNFFVQIFSQGVEQAKAQGAPSWFVDLYNAILGDIKLANSENRGKTGPLPLCSLSLEVEPWSDRQGRNLAYNKPMLLLADDFSASGADAFAAVFQDNYRGPVFGWRTMGLGGSVGGFDNATTYTEGTTRITWTQMNRRLAVSGDGLPMSNYVENVGVRPDIQYDMQTRQNLMTGYAPYVNAFTNAIVNHIRSSR